MSYLQALCALSENTKLRLHTHSHGILAIWSYILSRLVLSKVEEVTIKTSHKVRVRKPCVTLLCEKHLSQC